MPNARPNFHLQGQTRTNWRISGKVGCIGLIGVILAVGVSLETRWTIYGTSWYEDLSFLLRAALFCLIILEFGRV